MNFRRLLQPFIASVTALLVVGYVYTAVRLTSEPWQWIVLALPFLLIWIVPVYYWSRASDTESFLDALAHSASYVCMAWVSFLVVLTLLRDLVVLLTGLSPTLAPLHEPARDQGASWVLIASFVVLILGVTIAMRGPRLRRVSIPIAGLHPDLHGYTIAQLTDIHVGRFIRRRYVARAVELAMRFDPDLVAVTGDVVDGSVEKLLPHVAPLKALSNGGRAFLVLGNHDCYAGANEWIAHFRLLGLHVLLNDYATVSKGQARIRLGGVLDPAAQFTALREGPRPELARGPDGADLRVLLAHNPQVAPAAAKQGFDLQLSGHTHAGQFFPWTLVVRLVHKHVVGLSMEGRMRVYVSPGTGSWGPPVRFGTQTEVTLLKLMPA
jgi:predicted MPP superfamily phosphohydrolase